MTTKDKLREALRTIDWFAMNYPDGLEAIEDRIHQHTGQHHLDSTEGTPKEQCGAITAKGTPCQHEANKCPHHRTMETAA